MTRRDDLRRIERKITRLSHISLGRTAARHRAELSGVDLSRPALAILAALHGEGPARLSTLSSVTHLEAPLVSREIRQLEAEGYVSRVADPDDGRAVIVATTELGRETYLRFRSTTDAIIAETFSDWTDDELVELAQVLERLEDVFTRVPTGQLTPERRATNGS